MNLKFKQSGGLTAASKRDVVAAIALIKKWPTRKDLYPRKHQYALPKRVRGLINLSGQDASIAVEIYRERNGWRKKNVGSGEAGYKTGTRSEDIAYKGHYKGYHGSQDYPQMKSYGQIDKTGKLLGFIIHDRTGSIHSGMGYHWEADTLGIKLVRESDGSGYHPDSEDVFTGFVRIRSQLIELADRRKVAQSKNSIPRAATKSTAIISIADSLRCGNCAAGTVAFARLIGIDPSIPQPVSLVVKAYMANENRIDESYKPRFARVVNAVLNQS